MYFYSQQKIFLFPKENCIGISVPTLTEASINNIKKHIRYLLMTLPEGQ